MAITVGKKFDPLAHYIGRGSPLGNPFVMTSEADRNAVCDKYQVWFEDKHNQKDPAVLRELDVLLLKALSGDLVLGCFCAPKRCHGDTIKRYLETVLKGCN